MLVSLLLPKQPWQIEAQTPLRPLKVCCGNWYQDVSNKTFRSCKLRGRTSLGWTCLCSTFHRCLIGLRSGESGGQVNTSNSFLWKPPFLCSRAWKEATAFQQSALPAACLLDWTTWAGFTAHTYRELVQPMTLLLVHYCSFLGPLLIATDHFRQGNPTRAFFLLWRHQLWEQNVNLLPNISHLPTAATMKR